MVLSAAGTLCGRERTCRPVVQRVESGLTPGQVRIPSYPAGGSHRTDDGPVAFRTMPP